MADNARNDVKAWSAETHLSALKDRLTMLEETMGKIKLAAKGKLPKDDHDHAWMRGMDSALAFSQIRTLQSDIRHVKDIISRVRKGEKIDWKNVPGLGI